MHQKLLFVVIVLLAVLVGCTKTEGPSESTFNSDQEYLQNAVSSQDSIADYSNSENSTIDDGGVRPIDADGFAKVGEETSPITPLRWGRKVDSVSRNVTVDIKGDSVAIATIVKTISGTLHIIAIRDSAGVRDTVQVTKPFRDAATRKVLFVRVRRSSDFRLNWKPAAISLVDGRSPANDFFITELRIATPRDTFTVTDPLNTWLQFGRLRGEIPRIHPLEPVQIRVTITSQNDSAEFVALRWGVGWGDGRHHRARIPLMSQSGAGSFTRVYERTFAGHRHIGRFNAVIDAISYATLYDDDTALYSNKFWGLPYVLTLF